MDLIAADRDDPALDQGDVVAQPPLMQLKNEEPGEYLRDLPWILRRELLSLGFTTLVDPQRLSMVPDLVRCMPSARRKRGWPPSDR